MRLRVRPSPLIQHYPQSSVGAIAVFRFSSWIRSINSIYRSDLHPASHFKKLSESDEVHCLVFVWQAGHRAERGRCEQEIGILFPYYHLSDSCSRGQRVYIAIFPDCL